MRVGALPWPGNVVDVSSYSTVRGSKSAEKDIKLPNKKEAVNIAERLLIEINFVFIVVVVCFLLLEISQQNYDKNKKPDIFIEAKNFLKFPKILERHGYQRDSIIRKELLKIS